MSAIIRRSANISACGLYRYWLSREWGPGPLLTFVMLNPSVADDQIDDPTIRRCIGFAQREGADGCAVVNLFALRSTDPSALASSLYPVGPENVEAIRTHLLISAVSGLPVVCAWGAHPVGLEAHRLVSRAQDYNTRLVCLGKTRNGSPRHPLYVKADQPFEDYP